MVDHECRLGTHHHATAWHIDIDDEPLRPATTGHSSALTKSHQFDRVDRADDTTLVGDDLGRVQGDASREESLASGRLAGCAVS